jgi:hypothetical protein
LLKPAALQNLMPSSRLRYKNYTSANRLKITIDCAIGSADGANSTWTIALAAALIGWASRRSAGANFGVTSPPLLHRNFLSLWYPTLRLCALKTACFSYSR